MPGVREHRRDLDVAERSAAPTDELDPRLALLFGEVVELKRVRSAQTGGRSLAEVGFRRAAAFIVEGRDPDAVAAGEIAFAAAHVALGPVDAVALEDAGVSAPDRRAIYHRAAERWLGPLDPGTAEALDRAVEAAPASLPAGVALLCEVRRTRPDGIVHAVAPSPDETEADHAWVTAVLAGLVERARGAAPGDAFALGIAHAIGAAAVVAGAAGVDPGIPASPGPDLRAALPKPFADRLAALIAAGAQTDAGRAFHVGHIVDCVLQQRHYANSAGFSLSDAMDPRDLVGPGPVGALQYEALTRLGFAF